MRNIFPLALLLLSTTSFSQELDNKLQGSWELKSFIESDSEDQNWQSWEDHILYQKHIVGSHFSWIKFNTQTNSLEAMGGGSYSIDENGQYIESLDFVYPPGSSELGQSIPFDATFKGKYWYHTGFAKVMDIDLDGNLLVVDSLKIEEKWKPIKAKNKVDDLVGAWDLEKYRDGSASGYIEYPDIIGYMKIITGSHYVWVKYDKEGDQVFAAGSGTYSYDGKKYVESVKMFYNSRAVRGATLNFDCSKEGRLWKIFGTVKRANKIITIDEFWAPKQVISRDEFDL